MKTITIFRHYVVLLSILKTAHRYDDFDDVVHKIK